MEMYTFHNTNNNGAGMYLLLCSGTILVPSHSDQTRSKLLDFQSSASSTRQQGAVWVVNSLSFCWASTLLHHLRCFPNSQCFRWLYGGRGGEGGYFSHELPYILCQTTRCHTSYERYNWEIFNINVMTMFLIWQLGDKMKIMMYAERGAPWACFD